MATSLPFDLVIGLDRSDAKADLHLIDTHTGQRSSLTLSTLPERLHDWLAQVRTQYPTGRVALCLEQPAGNLIVFLETYAWITLYAINPSTLQHFRDAFVTSRAKDDTQDARYLAELTLSHHDKLPVWTPEDSQTRRLQHTVLHRRAVVDERTELTNRLEALLKAYFPQALELCGEELWRPLATEFLLQWPTLQAAQKAKPAALKEFYYKQGSRSQTLIEQRVERIAKAIALTDEAAVLDTYARRVQLICRQLQLVVAAIKDYDRDTAELFAQHPDRAVFAELPGAGPALAPRLLASMGSQRERFPTAASLQRYTGIAPVTKQSGGKRHVHRRYCCPKFHRQSFHEFAGSSILFCGWAAAYYAIHREETGCGHHTAVRALAYKWQRIIWRCWQKREAYDEARYEKALRKQGSRVAARIDQIEIGKNPHKAKLQKPAEKK